MEKLSPGIDFGAFFVPCPVEKVHSTMPPMDFILPFRWTFHISNGKTPLFQPFMDKPKFLVVCIKATNFAAEFQGIKLSVAPACLGKHLAIGQETLQMFTSKKTIIMEAKNNFQKNLNIRAWHADTNLGCDVKTLLRIDRRMKTGKDYQGVLRLDSEAVIDEFRCCDPHYTFIETQPWVGKRNPHVFVGQYITITRRDDGSLRPNFKPMPAGMSVDDYACGVYRELRGALMGLVEEG